MSLSYLHDGDLLAISLDGDNSISLLCRPIGQPRVRIQLAGIVDFVANNFRTGNIILSVDVYSSVDQLEENIVRGLAYSDRPEHLIAFKERLRPRDKNGELKYLVLESSYGCDLAAICSGPISVETIDA
jgi:hypothetical protein